MLNIKEPGFAGFENPWPLRMANDAKIRVLGKDQMQGMVMKTQNADEPEGGT